MNKILALLSFYLIFSIFPTTYLLAGPKPHAQPSVPIQDSVYDDIDILVSHGLVKTVLQGQKPWTRSEIARLIAQADKNNNLGIPYVDSLIKDLKDRFNEQLVNEGYVAGSEQNWSVHFIENFDLKASYLNSPERPYNQTNIIDANFNPLVENRSGQQHPDGGQFSLETTHWGYFSPYFSAFINPRIQTDFIDNSPSDPVRFHLQESYASFAFWNTQIDVGRKSIHWGQSRYGGLVFSANARPLDGIQIYNPSPWHTFLGQLRYSFFLANLGPEQRLSKPYITGLKVSVLPAPYLEIGASRALILGGSGSPNNSLGSEIAEFFAVRSGSGNASNSITGFELRGRIPPLRNIELYGEFYFDDINAAHLFRSFIQDSGLLAGIYLPRLDHKGSMSLRLEGRKNSSILYKHGTWTSGWTENGLVLGDPLGADAESLSVTLRKRFNSQTNLWAEFNFERIDSDTYVSGVPEGRRVAVNGPAEKRLRFITKGSHLLADKITGHLHVGYERVYGFNFTPGNNRNNFLIQTGITFNTDNFFRLKEK